MPGAAGGKTRSYDPVQGIVEQLQRVSGNVIELSIVGTVDDGSTPTVVLGPAGTFTGASLDVSNYSAATIQVFTDQDSAPGGLSLQTSVDGTNWDHTHDYNVTASVARHIDFTLIAQFFRVVYTNGATLQTVFRMQVKLHKNPPAMHTHPLSYVLDDDHPAAIVRSVIAGKDYVTGDYRNAQTFRTTTTVLDALLGLVVDPAGNALTLSAHDAADGGNPLKVGGRAADYTPVSSEAGHAIVAADDRANLATNRRGEIVPAVKPQYFDVSAMNVTYNNVTTTVTVDNLVVWPYREFCIQFQLAVANTPTDIRVSVYVSRDGTNYAKLMNNGMATLVYSTATIGSGIARAHFFQSRSHYMRIVVTAAGSTAANTFTISNAALQAST